MSSGTLALSAGMLSTGVFAGFVAGWRTHARSVRRRLREQAQQAWSDRWKRDRDEFTRIMVEAERALSAAGADWAVTQPANSDVAGSDLPPRGEGIVERRDGGDPPGGAVSAAARPRGRYPWPDFTPVGPFRMSVWARFLRRIRRARQAARLRVARRVTRWEHEGWQPGQLSRIAGMAYATVSDRLAEGPGVHTRRRMRREARRRVSAPPAVRLQPPRRRLAEGWRDSLSRAHQAGLAAMR